MGRSVTEANVRDSQILDAFRGLVKVSVNLTGRNSDSIQLF